MSRFTIRVELHKAKEPDDYDVLHEEMAKEGFLRTIQDYKTKQWYQLPTAEYNYMNDDKNNKKVIITKASNAAKRIGKKFSLLVTRSSGRTWKNLVEVSEPF